LRGGDGDGGHGDSMVPQALRAVLDASRKSESGFLSYNLSRRQDDDLCEGRRC
jgi:quinol monooxygenase YgiN